jgi:hypothetical protein
MDDLLFLSRAACSGSCSNSAERSLKSWALSGQRIEGLVLKMRETASIGRNGSEFGSVRPRVQIPGPRPILEFEVSLRAELT